MGGCCGLEDGAAARGYGPLDGCPVQVALKPPLKGPPQQQSANAGPQLLLVGPQSPSRRRLRPPSHERGPQQPQPHAPLQAPPCDTQRSAPLGFVAPGRKRPPQAAAAPPELRGSQGAALRPLTSGLITQNRAREWEGCAQESSGPDRVEAKGQRERERETERQRQRQRETERETERERQRQRQRERDRETERQRDRERERERERDTHT